MLFAALLFALRLTPSAPDVAVKTAADGRFGENGQSGYGAGNAVYFARSEDAGKTFSPPVKVAEPKALMLGMHRGPRIVIAGDAIVDYCDCWRRKRQECRSARPGDPPIAARHGRRACA